MAPRRGEAYAPDAAIVNLYAPGAHLGLHRDGEEPSDAPVVTISLGDSCLFRFAGVERRTGPFTDVELRSGDLLVFGGPSRRIYHGVTKVLDGTSPDGLEFPPGRLSITLRATGLEDAPRVSGFPGAVGGRHADGARPVARGDRGGFVGEEHALRDVSAGGDRAPCRTAVEATVDVASPMPAEQARIGAEVRDRPSGPSSVYRLLRGARTSARRGSGIRRRRGR